MQPMRSNAQTCSHGWSAILDFESKTLTIMIFQHFYNHSIRNLKIGQTWVIKIKIILSYSNILATCFSCTCYGFLDIFN